MREVELRRYLEAYTSDEVYILDIRGIDPGSKILPRLSRFWSLKYIGEVRRISLRDQVFHFSEKYIIPYSTQRGVWIHHEPGYSETILSDPVVLSREITPAHAEI